MASQLIDERIAERAAEVQVDDLAWAKPYLEQAPECRGRPDFCR
jgi:hypothetical protein